MASIGLVFDGPPSGKNGGMESRRGGIPAVAGEQPEQHLIVETETRQQHLAGRQLDQLGAGETQDQGGRFGTDAQTEHGDFPILAQQPLGEHQVGEIDFPDFVLQRGATHPDLPGDVVATMES